MFNYLQAAGQFVRYTLRVVAFISAITVLGLEPSIAQSYRFAIEPRFEAVHAFNEGLAVAAINNKWGHIDKRGAFVVQPIYDFVTSFSEGLSAAKVGGEKGRIGYIDQSGRVIINFQFRDALPFQGGKALVCTVSGECYYIDRAGRRVDRPSLKEGQLKPEKNPEFNRYGFVDRSGNYVVPPVFEDAFSFCNEFAVVKKGNVWGVIDKLGRLVVDPQFDDANSCWGTEYKRYNAVQIGDLWGVVDVSGAYIIAPRFKMIRLGQSEWFAARESDLFGYIDEKGKFVVPSIFEEAGGFVEGLAVVKYKGKWGFISRSP